MSGHVEYQIEKYSFTEASQTPRLARQWAEALDECRQARADSLDRLRIALLNVDYVTSFELPFRLLLIRTPQLIDELRQTLPLGQKNVTFNGNRYGCVYSLKSDLADVPEAFRYHFSHRIRRVDDTGLSTPAYQQIAKQTKAPRERLRLALESGLEVTALDGLFWFGLQRIAADIQRLRASGMRIVTGNKGVSDTLTDTTRTVPVYRMAGE